MKLGLLKQFIKALPIEGKCFKYHILAFPGLSIEKIKAGVFDGLQILEVIKDEHFIGIMSELEKNAWFLTSSLPCQELSWKCMSNELH